MKTSVPVKTRIYIKVSVNGETYNSRLKTRVIDFVQGRLSLEGHCEGTCKVIYNARLGLWNEFRFNSLENFKQSMRDCTESTLLNHIKQGVWI